MASAGYSKRALVDKLGIKSGMTVVVLGAPSAYRAILGALPDGVTFRSKLSQSAEFIHYFTTKRKTLQADFPRVARALVDEGSLWISWPKRASGVETDLDENVVARSALLKAL